MIVTSLDGQWAAVRRGREVSLFASAMAPALGQLTLEADDVDLAAVGPPHALAVLTREHHKLVLHQPPYLDAVARLDLEGPFRIAAVTGPRLALVSADGKQVLVVRAAGRALTAQPLEVGSPVEFAVGLEKNQLLFGLLRKLEVWDAISGRPLLRLQLQLPPPPRSVGSALGHLWVTRGNDEIFVYRLSDGRPFRHAVGATVSQVISHPASPVIVLVTPRGLVRLHCFAHTLTAIESPWRAETALALLATGGEDGALVGSDAAAREPWRLALGSGGAPISPDGAGPEPASEPVYETPGDKLRAMRADRSEPVEPHVTEAPRAAHAPGMSRGNWREALAVYGGELARGEVGDVPVIAVDCELGALAHRLGLPAPARRALIALYALYLIGEPAPSIARLARALGDWTEALGKGELGALAMLRRKRGTVALRSAVTNLIDGCPPRAIRLVGDGPLTQRPGAHRVARSGRSDIEIEAVLATELGRIAVVEGPIERALLEARLHDVTAVTTKLLADRPRVWPRDGGLVLVLYGSPSSWIADLPALAL